MKNSHSFSNRFETHHGKNHPSHADLSENWQYNSQQAFGGEHHHGSKLTGQNRNNRKQNHEFNNGVHAGASPPKFSKKELRKQRKAAKAAKASNQPTHASSMETSTTGRKHQRQTKHTGANGMRNTQTTYNTANHHHQDDKSDYQDYENSAHLTERQKKKMAQEKRNGRKMNGNGGQQQRGQRKQSKGRKQKHQRHIPPSSDHSGQLMDHLHGAAESDVDLHAGGDYQHSVGIHNGGNRNAQELTKRQRKKLARQMKRKGGTQIHGERVGVHLNGHQKMSRNLPPHNLQTSFGISGKHSTHGIDHVLHIHLHQHTADSDMERANSGGQ